MTIRKIWLIVLASFLLPLSSPASWQDDVGGYLGPIPFYADLAAHLERVFPTVAPGEKGAVALVIAYCYRQLEPGRQAGDLVENLFDRAAAERNNKVSRWLKRCLVEFAGQDLELAFLSPEREGVRRAILDFRDRSRREFPVLKVTGSEARTRGKQTTLKLDLHVSAPCGYEISTQTGKELTRGRLTGGNNRLIVPLTGGAAAAGGAVDILVFNKYLNRLSFTFAYRPDPDTADDGTSREFKTKPRTRRLRLGPILGTTHLLADALLLRPLAGDDSLLPHDRADLHASRITVDTLAWGFVFKGLVGGLWKQNNRPRPGKYKKNLLGITFSPYTWHRYLAYTQDGTTPAGAGDEDFSARGVTVSASINDRFQLAFFYRSLKGERVYIGGGTWNTRHRLVGITAAGTISTASPGRGWIMDFYGGPFLALVFNEEHDFIQGTEDPRVREGQKISYGFSGGVRLGIRCFKNVYLALGSRYFYPISNFQFNADPFTTYRLQRHTAFIGLLLSL